jgi:hypothetical protein
MIETIELMKQYPALSVRQPWAWAIVYGNKNIENRTWQTEYRGPVLIHAGRQLDPDFSLMDMEQRVGRMIPALERRTGGIVGIVDVVGMTRASKSDWFCGPWGWQLNNPRPLDFVACRGALSLFRAKV